ncbi:MAG: S8 family serine peptidase [Armatimonadetes bacterium]|nr:S8 family serine peptidase [Armatimonadota bacterium]
MKSLSLLALAAVAGSALAQKSPVDFVPVNRTHFVEKPGQMEFTGEMVVRPLQKDALLRMGYNELGAKAKMVQAANTIQDISLGHIDEIDVYTVRVPHGMDENSLAKQLMSTGLYEYVEPNYRVFPAYTPNDTLFASQWSHSNNGSTNAWDIMRGNSAVLIAITDTGIHTTHEDIATLGGRRVSGANSATASNTSQVLTEAVNGVSVVQDLHGHGTHCTGIAAAETNNGKGVAGVNIEGTRHIMVRVSNSSGGSSSLTALSVGALWAGENGADVVSTSYSGVQNSIFQTTGNTLKNTWNAVYCFAAGNDGGTYNTSDWADVTIVGALTSGNGMASFSARGLFIDVFAPGQGIWSTVGPYTAPPNSYANWDGTSMATPYAAGVAGMIFSMNPNYSAQRVEDILYRSCITMGAPATNGWGRVNLWNAMGRVANNVTVSPGVQLSGNLQSLYRVDGDKLVCKPGIVANNSIPPVQVTTEHNVPGYANNNYSEIAIETTCSVSVNGAMKQRIQIFNFASNGWEDVATGNINGSFFEAVKSVDANTVNNYISNGAVRVKTQCFAAGPITGFPWQVSFDQINVRCLRATE